MNHLPDKVQLKEEEAQKGDSDWTSLMSKECNHTKATEDCQIKSRRPSKRLVVIGFLLGVTSFLFRVGMLPFPMWEQEPFATGAGGSPVPDAGPEAGPDTGPDTGPDAKDSGVIDTGPIKG